MRALAAAIVLAGPAAAQEAAPVGGGPFLVERGPGTMIASELTAISVVAPDGTVLGDVSETILTHDGRIGALVVGVGGLLGLNEKPVAIPYDRFTVRELDEGFELVLEGLGMADLEAAPEYVPRGG